LHLDYALVYHQSDFNVIASKKRKCPAFCSSRMKRVPFSFVALV